MGRTFLSSQKRPYLLRVPPPRVFYVKVEETDGRLYRRALYTHCIKFETVYDEWFTSRIKDESFRRCVFRCSATTIQYCLIFVFGYLNSPSCSEECGNCTRSRSVCLVTSMYCLQCRQIVNIHCTQSKLTAFELLHCRTDPVTLCRCVRNLLGNISCWEKRPWEAGSAETFCLIQSSVILWNEARWSCYYQASDQTV